MRDVVKRLPPRKLVILCMILVSGLLSDTVSAQFYPEWYDSLFFRPVEVYYPGEGDTGTMRAELQWSPLEVERRVYAYTCVVQLAWGGPIVCDSFVPVEYPGDSLYCLADLDTVANTVAIQAGAYQSYPPVLPGVHRLGAMYLTCLDTGVMIIESVQPPVFYPSLGVHWYGTYVTLRQRISAPGDFNSDGVPGEIADAMWLIDYIFGGFPPDEPAPCADANGDCIVNISDAVYLIWYIFAGGPVPSAGCQF